MYPLAMTEELTKVIRLTATQLVALMRGLGIADNADAQRMAALSKAMDISRLTADEWEFFSEELECDRLTHMGLAMFGKAFSKAHLNYDERSALTVLFSSSEECAA